MKEKAVADFVGRYVVDPSSGMAEEPRDCRVVMSKRRLVVAGDDRLTIPLSSVVDVVVGSVPADLRDLFDDTVTVAHQADESIRTILIEGSSETMSRFADVLFKCLLNGTELSLRHPARIGGRVMDTDVSEGKLSIDGGRVEITTPNGAFDVDVSTVIDFTYTDQAPDGFDRPTLVVKHADGSDTVTSFLSPDSSRRVNMLGRFLRIEYSQIMRELDGVELSDPEKRVLVTVYATGGDIDFTQILDGNAAQATNVLNSLRDKGLVDEGETGIALTSQGQIVVTQRLEDVNV